MAEPRRPRVVLGVAGGIAAYKACEVLRLLVESAHDVRVLPTRSALRFVGTATWEALSGQPATTDVFTDVHEVAHVRLGREADLVLVVPATADLMARMVHGRADDMLTATLLTARCPVVVVPAMHTEMWEHPATRDNVATLRARGVRVIEPAVGRLTGPDSGKGRLPDPEQIVDLALSALPRDRPTPDLSGRRVLVTAGGTREPLDPVRYLGNRSSGLMGYALATVAAARGAEVSVLAANVSLPDPAGVQVVPVETTAQLHDVAVQAAAEVDAIVMAAAPADYRPVHPAEAKIKKASDGSAPAIELVQTPDILADLVRRRSGSTAPVLVGFAAETGDDQAAALDHGRRKLARKGCDLLVVNDVSGGRVFGQDETEAVVLDRDGGEHPVARGSKHDLAHVVWDLVAKRLASHHRTSGGHDDGASEGSTA